MERAMVAEATEAKHLFTFLAAVTSSLVVFNQAQLCEMSPFSL